MALAQPVGFQDWQLVRSEFRGFCRSGARRSLKAHSFEWRFLAGLVRRSSQDNTGKPVPQLALTWSAELPVHVGETLRDVAYIYKSRRVCLGEADSLMLTG